MKIVTEEHYVPERRYTTTKYIASDGREFTTEDGCLEHEKKLEIKNHPVFKNCIIDILTFDDRRGHLYYLSNEDDYKFLTKNLGFRRNDGIYSDFYDYGEGWYLYWCEDGGDCWDHHNIRNYNAYVKEIETELKEWKENIQNKINKVDNVKHGHWIYWDGWKGNSSQRIDDATCSECGYKHPTVWRNQGEEYNSTPDKLADYCPSCKAIMNKG